MRCNSILSRVKVSEKALAVHRRRNCWGFYQKLLDVIGNEAIPHLRRKNRPRSVSAGCPV
jgi:hypothetical protein